LKRRYHKVLGLAIGERSLLVAEIADGKPPEIQRLAEFVYPADSAPERLGELGPGLAQFLRDHRFTARVAVVGIPAGWLLVKPKEVPPADEAALADLLRLQAEGEFSTELKDLVYDYAGQAGAGGGTVLLMAAPRRYLDAAAAMCESARLTVAGVTPSAAVLGEVTGRAVAPNAVVLAVGPAGGELTSHSGSTPSAIRRLRAPLPQPLFISELRRAVSMLPSNGSTRQVILWDGAGLDAAALGTSLGLAVRRGELPSLGVGTTAVGSSGQQQYAAAVALALSGLSDRELPVDFLHSRLAAVKKSRVPMPVALSVVAALLLIGASVFAWNKQQNDAKEVADKKRLLDGKQDQLKTARAFVDKVSFAQAWHGGDPRYLACLRDLTTAIPDDGQTYATSLVITDEPSASGAGTAAAAAQAAQAGTLSGRLDGRAPTVETAQRVMEGMNLNKAFVAVAWGGSANVGGSSEVTFSISFTYQPTARKS
jgi:hypothetical protein